jgi:uncharacterized protein (DUF885 family)
MKRTLARLAALGCVAAMLRVASVGAQVEGASASPRPSSRLEPVVAARVADLHRLLDEQWEYRLRRDPEDASYFGDRRYNDRLHDYSQPAVERDFQQTRTFLRRFEAIDTSGFPGEEKLNRDLMVRDLREMVEAERFKDWEMPVNQFFGPHIDLPQLVTALPFATIKDYDDYVARLLQVPRVFRETAAQMRSGMADGLMPPRILIDQVASQVERIAKQTPEETPFAVPTTKIPNTFSTADQHRLRERIVAVIRDSVLPAYVTFAAFVRDEYAPKGRASIAISALLDGRARYAFLVRTRTTTNMTPGEIHELGLREVARIEAEELAIAQRLGFATLRAFRDSLAKMPALHPKSREQILEAYRRYTDQMWAQLPKLFGRLPKAKLEIRAIEPFREKESSTHYIPATPDGSRPGHVYVRTYDYSNQLLIREATAYHEGVPGHHLQVSIAQELSSLPPFRQHAGYTAFIEGWGLYAERLGKEIGFYQSPYNDYGRLDSEMFRAIRLVLDTGIHDKNWTRDQVVQFFREHSSIDEARIQAETDRYIAVPAQALAYKVGQLAILGARERARHALGDRFDLRAFHDEVLGAGALPLDTFEQRMAAWMARVQAAQK